MGGRIRQRDIEAVREAAKIEEVVGATIALRGAGHGSLKGLCPFHEERTPSFHVTPAKGLYYCFGCGEGGDAIDFVMASEHLTFTDAIEKLAAQAGISIEYEQGGPSTAERSGKRAILAINAAAADYFRQELQAKAAAEARRLLTERGFAEPSWERFGVGFAPQRGLLEHMRSLGHSRADLIASGLVGEGDRGVYPRFRNRLVWPIRDISGDVLGFGARRLAEDAGPKYLNTPETTVYHKSQVLYGLDQAKKAIAEKQQVVIVEGYTDVMACHLAGVTNAVATCGTAFGAEHAKMLRRLLLDKTRSQIVFTFDGDAAGASAAVRAFTASQELDAQSFVALVPGDQDPCDLRLTQGDAAVGELLAQKRPLLEFVLRQRIAGIDCSTPDGRAGAARAVNPVLAEITEPTLRSEYVRLVAGWIGLPPEALLADNAQRGATSPDRENRGSSTAMASAEASANSALERAALQVVLQYPNLAGDWIAEVSVECFTARRARQAIAVIAAVPGFTEFDNEKQWIAAILAACPDDDLRAVVRSLVAQPLPVDVPTSAYAIGVIARLIDVRAERDVAEVRGLLAGPDVGDSSQLLTDLMELEQYRRELRQYWAGV